MKNFNDYFADRSMEVVVRDGRVLARGSNGVFSQDVGTVRCCGRTVRDVWGERIGDLHYLPTGITKLER